MRIGSFIALLGFIVLTAGTFSPLLSFGIRMNVYSLNKPYGITMLVIAVVGILGSILQQRLLAKIASFASLLLVVLLYAAAFSKVNSAFSFIPFKGLSTGLSHLIKFKWGWYVLFIGGVIAVVGSIANRPPVTITKPSEIAPI
ncbi:hypothetical protein BDD43_2871 [Mucilaginibacter gracilis]|uniref:Uncharacterized protein n=1 Tax=Mucilaginibacter gracilis TaxID=423350 RepID=A0A495J114_9SPHI|nr:hypothetical protein [Mucilaginibacter gracilis]RKR82686.1 hypothetical protein BDD43_2871 [Mucilaginibacter gracilis]